MAYHSLIEGNLPKDVVRSIACYEFCVLSLMYFLSAAAYGVLYRHSSDHRLRDNVGVLAPLGVKVRHLVDSVGFKTLIDGCDLDPTL